MYPEALNSFITIGSSLLLVGTISFFAERNIFMTALKIILSKGNIWTHSIFKYNSKDTPLYEKGKIWAHIKSMETTVVIFCYYNFNLICLTNLSHILELLQYSSTLGMPDSESLFLGFLKEDLFIFHQIIFQDFKFFLL